MVGVWPPTPLPVLTLLLGSWDSLIQHSHEFSLFSSKRASLDLFGTDLGTPRSPDVPSRGEASPGRTVCSDALGLVGSWKGGSHTS